MNFRSATSVVEDQDLPHPNSLTETSIDLFPEDTPATDWVLNSLYGKHPSPEEAGSGISTYWKNEVEDFAPQSVFYQIDHLSGGLFTTHSELMPRWILWGMPREFTWPNVDASNFRARLMPARSEAVTFFEEDVSSHLKLLLLLAMILRL